MSGVSRLTRVKKLEAVRRTGVVGRFFMLWGSDHQDVLVRIRDALDAGTITPDSPMFATVWPLIDKPMPTSRWASYKELGSLEADTLLRLVLQEDDCGPTDDKRNPAELTDDELMECIVIGSRVQTEHLVRAVLH